MANKYKGRSVLKYRFVKGTAGVYSAITVLAAVVLCLLFSGPVAAIESLCSDNGSKVLIAYESKHGSTEAYVRKLGEELCKRGYRVDIDRYANLYATDLSQYAGVVFGSGVYWGSTIPQLRRFLEAQKEALKNKPIAYLHNALEDAQTGNSGAFSFWLYGYTPLFSQYNDIFHLTECLDSQMRPKGECDLSIDPLYGYPKYKNCDPPFWVGLMPGRYDPRQAFPNECMAMEIFGFGGYKDLTRPEAATEFAETLAHVGLFNGACVDNNISPAVTGAADQTFGTAPLAVNFTANGTDEDGTIISYLWKFGDGSASDKQNVAHTYSCSGKYTAKLQVMDNNCGIAFKLFKVRVASPGGGPSYECDVDPVMEKRCTACHGSAGGLSLKSCEDLALGRTGGYVVVPGDKKASALYNVMAGNVANHPPTQVTKAETRAVSAWIESLDPSCQPSEVCSCAVSSCPFKLLMGSESPHLKKYRTLRDTVLNKSEEGKNLALLLYNYESEITSILAAHPALKGKALKLIMEALPTVEQMTSNKKATVKQALLEKAHAFIEQFSKHASDSLKADLIKIQDDLTSGRIMKTFGVAME